MALGEVLQDSRTVVADRRELQSFRFKSLFCILQLHELRFAERSAIGGMEEKENRTLQTLQRLVRLFVAELISQSKMPAPAGRPPSQEMEESPDWQGNPLPQREGQTVQKRKVSQRDFHFCPRLATAIRFRIHRKVTHRFLVHGSFCISVPARCYRACLRLGGDQQKSFRQLWKPCCENPISSFVHVLRMIVETAVKRPLSRNQSPGAARISNENPNV